MLENITRRENLEGTDPPATKQAHPTISPEIVRSLVLYCHVLKQYISNIYNVFRNKSRDLLFKDFKGQGDVHDVGLVCVTGVNR